MRILGKSGLAAVAAAAIAFAGAAEAGPVRVGHSTWVGNGPLYIARDKGYFAEEGVEFEDVNLPPVWKRAIICYHGRLTPDFEYLSDYL